MVDNKWNPVIVELGKKFPYWSFEGIPSLADIGVAWVGQDSDNLVILNVAWDFSNLDLSKIFGNIVTIPVVCGRIEKEIKDINKYLDSIKPSVSPIVESTRDYYEAWLAILKKPGFKPFL